MRLRIVLAVTLAIGLVAALPAPSGAVSTAQTTLVSANPADYTPFIKDDPATPTIDRVNAVAVVGNRVILGGQFSTVKNWQGGAPQLPRHNLMAFDATTGAVDPGFVPTVDGEVTSVKAAPGGTAVFVGGKFKKVNGVAQVGVAKLSVSTGHIFTDFNASTNGWVLTLVVRGSRLYLGGTFTAVRSVWRQNLAAVDTTTGTVDLNLNVLIGQPIANATFVSDLDVSAGGSRLVILGNFQTVGGLPRAQLAVLALSAAAQTSVVDWNTDDYRPGVCSGATPSYVRAVDISPNGQYFVVVSTGAWRGTGTLCDTAARWELGQSTGTGQHPTWAEYTGGDTLTSVAVTGVAVYVGGHQRWMNNSNTRDGDSGGPGSTSRNGIAALDPVNGMAYAWNPGRDRGAGVFDMVATSKGLYIGHDTDAVGGEFHPRIAFFPLTGGAAIPNVVAPTFPTTYYSALADGRLVKRAYDGSQFGPVALVRPAGWNHVRGAFTVNQTLYTGRDDGRLLKRSFDGTTFGDPVDLGSWTSFADVTGMFFTDGRLYFTRADDPKLYFRKFEPQDDLIGSQLFVVSGNGDGLDWSTTSGMTTIAGKIYVADKLGYLRSVTLSAGAPVPSSSTVISGPIVDARNWTSTAIFTS